MDHLTVATSSAGASGSSPPKKREYRVDPALPDIRSSEYATDEFRMFSFKIEPCPRAYSHVWTECPFAHSGESARRRDPRTHCYSPDPCAVFRRVGDCPRGDDCENAHGIFESWLHPAQYRTRMCTDGENCTRRVCFFAHSPEELRPLHPSSALAVPPPRSTTHVLEYAGSLYVSPRDVHRPHRYRQLPPRLLAPPNVAVPTEAAVPIPPPPPPPVPIVSQGVVPIPPPPQGAVPIVSQGVVPIPPPPQGAVRIVSQGVVPIPPPPPPPVQQLASPDIGPPSSPPDWSDDPELARLRRPAPPQVGRTEDQPDLSVSWLQSLVTHTSLVARLDALQL